jgi:AcrR family transcriptional regulator
MRARLARAAYEEIAEKGHSEFRTAPVVERAGVSKGAMQYYFPTKDLLTLAAVEYSFGLSAAASEFWLAQPAGDSGSLVAVLFEDLGSYFSDNRFWVTLDITIHASKSGHLATAIRQRITEARRATYGRWADRFVALGWRVEKAELAVTTAVALHAGGAIRSLWAEVDDALKQAWKSIILDLR